MREAAEHEANERRRADPPEARKGNASPQPYHQHREQMIDAAQRMEQTGGKARQSVVAGMGRYRRREGDQRKHRPTKRDIQGRSKSEEHTSELQSLMRISYAVFCLKKKNTS